MKSQSPRHHHTPCALPTISCHAARRLSSRGSCEVKEEVKNATRRESWRKTFIAKGPHDYEDAELRTRIQSPSPPASSTS
jgi:hypothetical protein